MESSKAHNQKQHKLKSNLKQQHLRNRARRLLCPGLKWCLQGLVGAMHNRLFLRSLRKRSNLSLRLRNLSRLKRQKACLRFNQSLTLKKAQRLMEKLKHCHLRGNIKRKVIGNRNSLKRSKKQRLRQKQNQLRKQKEKFYLSHPKCQSKLILSLMKTFLGI